MLRKIISIITLISFVSYLCGCSSIEVVQLNESNFDDYRDSNIVSVVTKDNKIYEFDYTGVRPKPQIMDSLLVGWAISELESQSYKLKEVKVPVSEIKTYYIEEVDVLSGLLVIVGIISLVSILWVIGMSTSDWNL